MPIGTFVLFSFGEVSESVEDDHVDDEKKSSDSDIEACYYC
jgi:hypothetical protein